MEITAATVLDCPLEAAWREVRTSRLLRHVAAPLVSFDPVEPPALPATWSPGTYWVQLRVLGLVPLGRHAIGIELPSPGEPGAEDDPDLRRVRDRGHGARIRVWDHVITLRRRPDGRTDYEDRVTIHAGALTPFVGAFAWIFYRHRQRRWRALARRGFVYGGTGS